MDDVNLAGDYLKIVEIAVEAGLGVVNNGESRRLQKKSISTYFQEKS